MPCDALQVPLYPESSVQVKLDSTEASEWQGDLLAIGLYEDDISTEGMSLPLCFLSCYPCSLPRSKMEFTDGPLKACRILCTARPAHVLRKAGCVHQDVFSELFPVLQQVHQDVFKEALLCISGNHPGAQAGIQGDVSRKLP